MFSTALPFRKHPIRAHQHCKTGNDYPEQVRDVRRWPDLFRMTARSASILIYGIEQLVYVIPVIEEMR
jgi:hypothetical protein